MQIGFIGAVMLILMTLKLLNLVVFSWIVVFLPVIIGFGAIVMFILACAFLALID